MIIKILPNKPLTLSLQFSSAIEKQGKYGLQFLYTLENGDGLYLPPIAHAEIQSLHVGPREPFTLTKSIGQGNQAQWKVERIVQPSAPAKADLERPAAVGVLNSTASIQQHTTKAPVRVMPAAAPSLTTPQSRAMVKQLFAAIDAIKLATDYAKSQQVPFEPTSRDICALAITGGIQVFKEGVY